MWKALIKWVESWSYRCEHDWEQLTINRTFMHAGDKLPYKTTYVYRCTKCCDSKQIKIQ